MEFHITALATATDWRCPPESEATGWRMERTVVTRRLLSVSPAAALHGILVEQPAAEPLAAQEHVLDDVQVVGEGQVLVDGLDAQAGGVAGGADVHRVALEEDLPVVDLMDAGDAAGEHRLAGAVVTAEPGDLSGGEVEVHLVERLDRTEVLVDAPQPQQRLRRGSPSIAGIRHRPRGPGSSQSPHKQ